ncbi:MAG: glycosyltransferase [Myxococcales bacterium]|nr:glycosyltransferase [Myxococcales bacterium]
MRKRRVFYLISSFAQGGAERHLLELLRWLDHDRFEPMVCVLRDNVHYTGDLGDQPRYRLGANQWYWPGPLTRLVSALRDSRADIVHTYLNDANLWGRLAMQLAPSVPMITSVHLDDMSAFYRGAERLLHPLSDRIVAHSESIRRFLTGRLGVPDHRVHVIVNGVDPQRFAVADEAQRAAARAAFDIEPGQFIALMPARIAAQKNQDLVVATLAEMREAGRLPANFRLLLAGRVSERWVDIKTRYLIRRHSLGDVVRFLGAVRDMQSLLWAADVVLLPSRTEASPIAALEGLSAGLPVVISDTSNTDTVVVDGEHGFEVPSGDRGALADAISRTLALTHAERAAMGRAGRQHIEAHFTTERVGRDFMALYDELTLASRAASGNT